MIAPSFFWNNFTQRALSQSNNISYAARGIYRVDTTEPNRKGDYWFRDFGMVMACAYLTELGFRATETLSTIPLATEAMNLHRLSQLTDPITGQLLYPGARNYSALPENIRERVMGTLIRNSADLVPGLMKVQEALELQNDTKLTGPQKDILRGMLESPVAEAEQAIQQHLQKVGLNLDDIRAISRIENQTRRDDAIRALRLKNKHLSTETIRQMVKLEDARQMGILMDHMHRNLNFADYLKTKYLSDHKLSGTVSEVIREYADKLANLQQKGKKEFAEAIEEALKLPIDKREDAFGKRFNEILASLEHGKGMPIATEAEYNELRQLGREVKAALKADNLKTLKTLQIWANDFYTRLKANHIQHLDTMFGHVGTDLRAKLAKKLEAVVDAVQKLEPGHNPKDIVAKKLDELNLGALLPEDNREAAEALKKRLQDLLPDHSQSFIDARVIKRLNAEIADFMAHALPENLVEPMFKKLPTKQEFQRLIMDGLHSKAMSQAISRIQKSGTWPKMAATVLLNLFFYGFLASNFDNKVLQPFQKKLVAERGTSQDIVTAGYLGTIPGLAVLTQLADRTSLPFFRRMGYFTRFAVVGGMALATFAGSTYALLMHRLKTPPQSGPSHPASGGSSTQTGTRALTTPYSFQAYGGSHHTPGVAHQQASPFRYPPSHSGQ